jgi:hypothetical protein
MMLFAGEQKQLFLTEVFKKIGCGEINFLIHTSTEPPA